MSDDDVTSKLPKGEATEATLVERHQRESIESIRERARKWLPIPDDGASGLSEEVLARDALALCDEIERLKAIERRLIREVAVFDVSDKPWADKVRRVLRMIKDDE